MVVGGCSRLSWFVVVVVCGSSFVLLVVCVLLVLIGCLLILFGVVWLLFVAVDVYLVCVFYVSLRLRGLLFVV